MSPSAIRAVAVSGCVFIAVYLLGYMGWMAVPVYHPALQEWALHRIPGALGQRWYGIVMAAVALAAVAFLPSFAVARRFPATAGNDEPKVAFGILVALFYGASAVVIVTTWQEWMAHP